MRMTRTCKYAQARKLPAGGCPFLTASTQSRAAFQDTLLAAPMDIEALAVHGKRRSLCSYYGARAALPEADLVLLPYGALLTEVNPRFACLRRRSDLRPLARTWAQAQAQAQVQRLTRRVCSTTTACPAAGLR